MAASTAHKRPSPSTDCAQSMSLFVWSLSARIVISPTMISEPSIATAVWVALCGSIPIVVTIINLLVQGHMGGRSRHS